MDERTQRKWDRVAKNYDLMTRVADARYAEHKRRFFRPMRGQVLMVAVGTGLDIQHFPPHQQIVAIDISPKMIEQAGPRAAAYTGSLDLRVMDVTALEFPDATFDTAFTVCTFCSVPDPVGGLREIRRVLKDEGHLYMFEHVRSKHPLLGLFLDYMTLFTRRFGPDLNRRTAQNLRTAGFTIDSEQNLYLDIVKMFWASKSSQPSHSAAPQTSLS